MAISSKGCWYDWPVQSERKRMRAVRRRIRARRVRVWAMRQDVCAIEYGSQ